ncbi:MAG: hypothetical protein HY264_00120 [Chloroflexi bacterium]|nr:hypothetical protein [Chloroflexota bacterium]
MPTVRGLGRLARLATLPETRRLITGAAHGRLVRVLVGRVVHDRRDLVNDLRRPGGPRAILPGRYTPLGWAARWISQKALRRFGDQGVRGEPGPAG